MRIRLNQKSGLGNQLFQYAAGLYFARTYGAELTVLRQPEAQSVTNGYARPFLLSEFAIAAEVRELGRWDRLLCSSRPRTVWLSDAMRAVTRTAIVREPVDHHWRYAPELAMPAGTQTLYLEGYWQVWQYAAAMETELRREFALRAPAEGQDAAVLAQMAAERGTAVSLHVRRGDYTLAAEGSPALGMEYYYTALREMHGRVADPVFYVFSDDIAYAREHLPQGERLVFVEHNGDRTAHQDLRLMAACQSHILANSSFSWWGAWLNPRSDKVVLAPDRSFKPSVPHTDLFPPRWVELPA